MALAADLGEDQRELIAAEPAQHIVVAQVDRQALGELAQQAVAGIVAQRIVHLLELVQIDQQQRAGAAGFGRFQQHTLELSQKEVTVGQLGDRIVVRELVQPALCLAALGELATQGGFAIDDAIEQRVERLRQHPASSPERTSTRTSSRFSVNARRTVAVSAPIGSRMARLAAAVMR